MTTKSDEPGSPIGELAHLHATLASIESAMRDMHPELVVPDDPGRWGDVLRQWNATQLAKVVEPDESVREWMQRWRAGEQRLKDLLATHNTSLPEGLWQWRHDPECYTLCRLRGQAAATVWTNGTWHTWNLDGIGGENSTEATVDQAMHQALAAVFRQEFDVTPEECESCGGSGYETEQDEEDPELATLRARCAVLEKGHIDLAHLIRSRDAIVDALSSQLTEPALDAALLRAQELHASPLDCSVVELRHAIMDLRSRLTSMHREIPRYPALGSMGGGSVREGELRAKWEKEVGTWGRTFVRLQGFVEGGLHLIDERLKSETARQQQCARCGKEVEEARRCYAIPHCFACVPPPPPLEIIQIGAGEFRMRTDADRQVYEAARHEALLRTADNAPGCPKCGCANFVIRKRCRDCGEDLVMHPDAAVDAEVRWDAEDARRADGEAFAASLPISVTRIGAAPPEFGPPTPGLNVEWSPFSMCGTPKNWGAYAPTGNEGWYCSVGVVDGFDALPDLSATGEGESLADAELDAMRKLLPQIVAYVPDTPKRQRAQLHALEVAARRLRAAVVA